MHTSDDLLSLTQVTIRYGRVEAVTDASFSVRPGEVVALLGANGAGKTSLLKSISGLVPVAAGDIRLRGSSILKKRPEIVLRSGIAHSPEGRRVVASLTVEENLELTGRASRRRATRADLLSGFEECYELFPRLFERRQQGSGLLSGGEQQMLAIARAIMARPEVMLLDEPSMGLAPIMTQSIYAVLSKRTGTLGEAAIILAEQGASLALTLADTACLLKRGEVVYHGPASELTAEQTVAAYMGTAEERQAGSPASP